MHDYEKLFYESQAELANLEEKLKKLCSKFRLLCVMPKKKSFQKKNRKNKNFSCFF